MTQVTEKTYKITNVTHITISLTILASIICSAFWFGANWDKIEEHMAHDYVWKDHVQFVRLLGRDNPQLNLNADIDMINKREERE